MCESVACLFEAQLFDGAGTVQALLSCAISSCHRSWGSPGRVHNHFKSIMLCRL